MQRRNFLASLFAAPAAIKASPLMAKVVAPTPVPAPKSSRLACFINGKIWPLKSGERVVINKWPDARESASFTIQLPGPRSEQRYFSPCIGHEVKLVSRESGKVEFSGYLDRTCEELKVTGEYSWQCIARDRRDVYIELPGYKTFIPGPKQI